MKAIKAGKPVVATWGYNEVTKKPYQFLFDFGYYTIYNACVVYNKGECNMQDVHIFQLNEIRLATKKDLKTIPWGN